jgi:hypothetical protein
MQNTTPMFPGFHLQTLRRTPRSARQKLVDEMAKIKQKSFSELAEYLAHIVPTAPLKKPVSGTMSRNRMFSKENTFWAFFSQVLDADGGCQEVVRKLQAVAAMYAKPIPSSSTSGYCQARRNLSLTELEAILSQISKRRLGGPPSKLQGRRVIVADGTGLSMPIPQPTKKSGHNNDTRSLVAVFRKHAYAPVLICSLGCFQVMSWGIRKVVKFHCYTGNGNTSTKVIFS